MEATGVSVLPRFQSVPFEARECLSKILLSQNVISFECYSKFQNAH